MSEIKIQRALPEDAQALLDYIRIIGGESDNLSFGAEGLPFTVEQEADFIRAHLGESKSILLIAKDGDVIVGNGSLDVLPRRMYHRAELGISVLRGYWGKGIGTMLLRELIAHGKKEGLDGISLEVRTDNTRAISLYNKFGFEKVATYPGYMKIDNVLVDMDLMYLKLQ